MKNKKGFTLIELILVLAILGIIATIAVPKFSGFRKKAKKAAIIYNIKNLENACAIYNIKEGGWPIGGNYEGSKTTGFYYVNGEIESLEDGDYRQIDYNKIKDHIDKPEDPDRYILKNPIGRVYYIREEGSGNGNSSNEEENTGEDGYVMTDEQGNQHIFKAEEIGSDLMNKIQASTEQGINITSGTIIKEDNDYYIVGYNDRFGQDNNKTKISDYKNAIKINGTKVYTDNDKVQEYGNLVWPETMQKGNVCFNGSSYYIAPQDTNIYTMPPGGWIKIRTFTN